MNSIRFTNKSGQGRRDCHPGANRMTTSPIVTATGSTVITPVIEAKLMENEEKKIRVKTVLVIY